MQVKPISSRLRGGTVCASVALTITATTVAGTTPVFAASDAAITGQLQAFAVPGSSQIQQLFAGADGQLWFATTGSRLGKISSTGQATLTGSVLPHGSVPAVIAGAGSEGVWSFGNDDTAIFATGACAIALITPGGVVEPVTLPSIAAPSSCGGGAADAAGNLWVSLGNPCGSFTCGRRVAFVAEITPSRMVTLFPPVRPGAHAGPVTLGNDGAIWVLGGNPVMTMGRYTPTSSTLGIQVPLGGDLRQLLPSSSGMFWGARPILCIGQTTEFCLRVDRFSPGAGTAPFFVFPVGINLSRNDQLGVDSAGALWEAGAERTEPDRFFRMNTTGTIDRTAAFPTPAGLTLHDDGTLAVTAGGSLWTSAQSTSGGEYLVRFLPTT
jgi:streptogramin lyase